MRRADELGDEALTGINLGSPIPPYAGAVRTQPGSPYTSTGLAPYQTPSGATHQGHWCQGQCLGLLAIDLSPLQVG
jgi:hypothetical protein